MGPHQHTIVSESTMRKNLLGQNLPMKMYGTRCDFVIEDVLAHSKKSQDPYLIVTNTTVQGDTAIHQCFFTSVLYSSGAIKNLKKTMEMFLSVALPALYFN